VSGYSLDTLRIALWGFLTTDNFRDAIIKVISLGNDTDTFAAVTGALAGACYGYEKIPNNWKNVIISHQPIRKIYNIF
jgi:ADP-ribosylglycohydrolase